MSVPSTEGRLSSVLPAFYHANEERRYRCGVRQDRQAFKRHFRVARHATYAPLQRVDSSHCFDIQTTQRSAMAVEL